jgi:hypothetical protein
MTAKSSIFQQLILSKDSPILNHWMNPPVDPTMKVYFFNYSNIEQYLEGEDEKIRLDEMGPYIYKQKINKFDVKFQDNFVTYRVSICSKSLGISMNNPNISGQRQSLL